MELLSPCGPRRRAGPASLGRGGPSSPLTPTHAHAPPMNHLAVTAAPIVGKLGLATGGNGKGGGLPAARFRFGRPTRRLHCGLALAETRALVGARLLCTADDAFALANPPSSTNMAEDMHLRRTIVVVVSLSSLELDSKIILRTKRKILELLSKRIGSFSKRFPSGDGDWLNESPSHQWKGWDVGGGNSFSLRLTNRQCRT